VLVLRGPDLSADVSDVDPHEVGAEVLSSKPLRPEAKKTARILNEFTRKSYDVMKEHEVNIKRMEEGKPPANIAMARGAGSPPDVPPFSELHGMKGAAVVGISLVEGVCRVSGLDIMDVPGATGGLDTDLGQKIAAAIRALGTHDFVLLHIKGTDICGHDDDPKTKADFIAKVDVELGKMLQNMGEELKDRTVICVTADHSTPCCVMDHSADPVPLLIWGKGLRRDRVETFGEHAAAHGGLGKIRGKDLLNIMKGQAGRAEKYGA
jgi:2,3-bisphosphoglycerate-independent phosphoglycerate mutase